MEKNKSSQREHLKQITFRISESLFERTKKEAESIGSSHNSFLLVMLQLGLKVYNGEYFSLAKK